MRVFVYTDASVFESGNEQLFSGGGGVIVPTEGKVITVKRCMEIQDINAAECRMVYVASRLAAEYYDDVHHVVTSTDSKTTVECYERGRKKNRKDRFRRELDRIRGYFGNVDMGFSLRWIRGHQDKETSDAIFNRKADRLASESVDWAANKTHNI